MALTPDGCRALFVFGPFNEEESKGERNWLDMKRTIPTGYQPERMALGKCIGQPGYSRINVKRKQPSIMIAHPGSESSTKACPSEIISQVDLRGPIRKSLERYPVTVDDQCLSFEGEFDTSTHIKMGKCIKNVTDDTVCIHNFYMGDWYNRIPDKHHGFKAWVVEQVYGRTRLGTVKNRGAVATAWHKDIRDFAINISHYIVAASLPLDERMEMLDWWHSGELPPVSATKAEVKRRKGIAVDPSVLNIGRVVATTQKWVRDWKYSPAYIHSLIERLDRDLHERFQMEEEDTSVTTIDKDVAIVMTGTELVSETTPHPDPVKRHSVVTYQDHSIPLSEPDPTWSPLLDVCDDDLDGLEDGE